MIYCFEVRITGTYGLLSLVSMLVRLKRFLGNGNRFSSTTIEKRTYPSYWSCRASDVLNNAADLSGWIFLTGVDGRPDKDTSP